MSNRKSSVKHKKKIEISQPTNFEHRVHTGYDALHGEFVDLPRQWAGVISPKSSNRPSPFMDPNAITPVSWHHYYHEGPCPREHPLHSVQE